MKHGSVEAAFNAALDVRAPLLEVLGDLSKSDFEAVRRKLTGIDLNQEEILVVFPEPAFFLDLARKRGTATDIAFFENYRATFPESVWPSYFGLESDVSGCTRLGSGELSARYEGWQAFRAKHPRAYARAVAERLSEIEGALTEPQPICGTTEEARRELRAFLERFPRAPIEPKVRERLRGLN